MPEVQSNLNAAQIFNIESEKRKNNPVVSSPIQNNTASQAQILQQLPKEVNSAIQNQAVNSDVPVNSNQINLQNQVQNIQSPNQAPQLMQNQSKKSLLKPLAMAGIGAVAIGGAIIAIKKNKTSSGLKSLLNKPTIKVGTNVIYDKRVENSMATVSDFKTKYANTYDKIKNIILENTEEINIEKYSQDGILYHGTNLTGAKGILENGASPFAIKVTDKTPTLGTGFYTCSTQKDASLYSTNGVVLPFKFEGKLVQMKQGSDFDLRSAIAQQLMSTVQPTVNKKVVYSKKATQFARDNVDCIINQAMQDLGIDAMVSKKQPFFSSVLAKVSKKGEPPVNFAIYNGEKVSLDVDKLKKINTKKHLKLSKAKK